MCRQSWKELKCRPLSLHSCEMSYLLSKWKEIFSPALSRVIRLWAQWITSHVLCKSHFLILYTSDSLLSWMLVCSDQDTLLLGEFQWLPIVYRMKERLSFVFKCLLHLAFIISLEQNSSSLPIHVPCFPAFTPSSSCSLCLRFPSSLFSSSALTNLTLDRLLIPFRPQFPQL